MDSWSDDQVDSIVVRLRTKEIDGPVTQGQENVKLISASAGGLWISQSDTMWKVLHLQRLWKIFFFLLSVIQEKG